MLDREKLVVSISGCSRCGEDHDQVMFERFDRPVLYDSDGKELTHWASCPTNGQPILMMVYQS